MNNSTLVGRLTRDPELKFTPGGLAICNTSIAVDKKLKKEALEKLVAQGLPTANFFTVRTFGKQAENDAKYLGKGSLVSVSGSHETQDYIKDNEKKKFNYFLAREVEYLSKKKVNNGQSEQNSNTSGLTDEEAQAIDVHDDIPF